MTTEFDPKEPPKAKSHGWNPTYAARVETAQATKDEYVKQMPKYMEMDAHHPVHMIDGAKDKNIFRALLVLMFLGLGNGLMGLWTLSWPRKN